MNPRGLSILFWIAVNLVVMGLLAYAAGRVTYTDWVWWLAPLTVALEGGVLFRARSRGSDAILSPADLRVLSDLGARIYLVSSLVAAGVAAWGVYTADRLAVFIGAAFAICGRAFECSEEARFEHKNEPA